MSLPQTRSESSRARGTSQSSSPAAIARAATTRCPTSPPRGPPTLTPVNNVSQNELLNQWLLNQWLLNQWVLNQLLEQLLEQLLREDCESDRRRMKTNTKGGGSGGRGRKHRVEARREVGGRHVDAGLRGERGKSARRRAGAPAVHRFRPPGRQNEFIFWGSDRYIYLFFFATCLKGTPRRPFWPVRTLPSSEGSGHVASAASKDRHAVRGQASQTSRRWTSAAAGVAVRGRRMCRKNDP